jgi:hypothetical protein
MLAAMCSPTGDTSCVHAMLPTTEWSASVVVIDPIASWSTLYTEGSPHKSHCFLPTHPIPVCACGVRACVRGIRVRACVVVGARAHAW